MGILSNSPPKSPLKPKKEIMRIWSYGQQLQSGNTSFKFSNSYSKIMPYMISVKIFYFKYAENQLIAQMWN